MKSLVRTFILLALLGYSTASMALSPGTYVSQNSNKLMAMITTASNGNLVLDVKLQNRVERYLITIQGGHHNNVFQFGKLALVKSNTNQSILGQLVAFEEPVSMKPLLTVQNFAGKSFSFLRTGL